MLVRVVKADERSARTGALYPLATLERDARKLGPCDVLDGAGKVVGRAYEFFVRDGWLCTEVSVWGVGESELRGGDLHVRPGELVAVVTQTPTDGFPDAIRFDFLVRFETLLLRDPGDSGWDE